MSMFVRRSFAIGLIQVVFAVTLGMMVSTGNLIGQTSSSPSPASNPRDNNPAPPGQTSPLLFRRIFIPEETVSGLSKQGIHFPMPADEFHRLMDKMPEFGQRDGKYDSQPVLNSLVLSARLDNQQLVFGKGVMRVDSGHLARHPTDSPGSTMPLSPFRLPVSHPAWSNGESALLGFDKFGETVLFFPPGASELLFDWTLRGETGTRNELVFSLELPRFLRTELILDLPEDKKPIVPSGLVQQMESSIAQEMTTESDIPSGYRRWRITVNGSQAIRLTVTPDETSEKFSRSIGVYEHHLYIPSLFGMQLETTFFLEESDFVLNELTLELDKPLSIHSVKVNDRVLPWTESSPENENVTRFLVSLPYLESGIRKIQVLTFCPILTDRMWDLPRVHIRSPLFFWTETRNIVRVNRPLLTRKINALQQRQVPPPPDVDETESDQFFFQAFSEESPLGIELGLKQTLLNVESGTSIQWGDRDINARTILELTADEGQIQQLEMDVDANWTIDQIEAADPTRVANYFIEDTEQGTGLEPSPYTRWIVPLRQAIDPSQPIRLIVQLRRPITTDELLASSVPAQNHRYPLSDFLPIRVPGSREGRQLIAFEPGRHYRMVADDRRESSMSSPTPEHIRERFDEIPPGPVFTVDESSTGYFLEIESLKPTYEMAAVTNLILQNGILLETCHFSCTPTENMPVGRLKVRFSPGSPSDDVTDWTWKLGQNPETARKLKAVPIVFSGSASTVPEETWELELPSLQSTPFVVTAARVIPFDSRQAIPLPFFPDLLKVDAFVTVETRDTIRYRVSQNFLRPVSSSFPSETVTNASVLTNHAVRGVYQYPADGGAFSPENAMLVLEPVSTSDDSRDISANIWSLALHTHFHPNGDVVTYAIVAVENQMFDRLKIGLPYGVTNADIRNLWIDRAKTSWSFVSGNGDGSGDNLFVTLPSQRRYLTVTLEYVEQGAKLTDFSRIRPSMPTFDVPVFTRKWYAWYPPEYRGFDVSVADSNDESQTIGQSHGKQAVGDSGFHLPFFGCDNTGFDLFSSRRAFFETIPTAVKTDITTCSLKLARLLEEPALEQRIRRPAATNGVSEISSLQGREETVPVLTWGELFASGVMAETATRNESSQNNGRYFNILIDGDSLAQAGVFPFTPVFPEIPAFSDAEALPTVTVVGNNTSREKGLELMECNNLAVILDGHHNLLVTSVLTAAKLRSHLVSVHADHFWYYPCGNIAEIVSGQNATETSVFLTPRAWQNKVHYPVFLFGMPANSRMAGPGWAVREMDCEGEFLPVLLLIRRDTLLLGKLFVFFIIVLASWRIRPDRLSWAMFPLVVAILLARLFPPYIACLVPSAFWGMVCVVVFVLIHRLQSRCGSIPVTADGDRTTVVSLREQADASESGEVRRIVVTSRPPDERQDFRGIPTTDVNPASKSVFLTLLVVTLCGFLFAGSGTLSAQSSSQVSSSSEFFLAPTPQGQPLSDRTSETSGNMSDRIRRMMDTGGFPLPHEVYIPYDTLGRIGPRYYLSGSLYDLLMQGSHKETSTSGRWRICKARYVGTFTHNSVSNEVTLSHLLAIYDIELEDASAVVRFSEMPVVPDEIRCDDRLVQPIIKSVSVGETGRNEFAVAVYGRGGHQLEFSLQPVIHSSNPEMTLHHFDFAIPSVPDSTLELTLPVSNLPVDVLYSFGQLSRRPDKLDASLGPVNRLSVSWPISPPPQVNVSVSQYFRLSVAPAPDQTKLHAVFRFTVSNGSINQIRLAIDPRYRLEENYRFPETIESFEPVAGAENLFQVAFAQPVTKNVTVEAVFVPRSISGIGAFSGIGTLSLPRFSVANVRIDQSWLGISSAPSTEVELPLSNVETRMFENAWGLRDEPVQYAYDLLRPQENWFLTVKNRPVTRQIDQRQWLLFRYPAMFAYLEESVTPSYDKAVFPVMSQPQFRETISTFSHEMVLPEGFCCETVEIKTADGERWEKLRVEQNDRRLVLFFKEPVIGKYTVFLFGTISCDFNKEIPFPLFTHDEQTTVRRSIFCSRDSSVLVHHSQEEQSHQAIENISCPMPAFPSGYSLSAFHIESPEHFPPATVSMSANKPEITGVMVSRLERDYPFTHWNMIVTCDVTISSGELNQISFFIPVHLTEQSTARHFDSRLLNIPTRQIPEHDGTQIQIQLREPLTGKQSFEIQFPLSGTLDAVSVPNVQLRHDCELEHFVALPENSGEKTLVWMTNLSPTDVVPPVLPLQQRGDDTTISLIDMALTYGYYRVGQRDFFARINLLNETAFVSCHDAAFFVKRNGFCFAVSVFDIQGNSATHCDIAFPAEYQLLEVQLDDVFPLPKRIDDATIRVELYPDVPVQRLAMVYCLRWDAAGAAQTIGPLSLVFPQILSVPVAKTLWEVWYEPLSTVDTQIDTCVNVRNGQEQFFSEHAMNALVENDAGNLRVRIELARLNQTLALIRLMSVQPQDTEKYSVRQPAWLRYWNATRRNVTRLLPEWNTDKVSWDKTFLHGKRIVPQDYDPFTPEWEVWGTSRDTAWMDAWISPNNTPQVVYDDLVGQFQTLTGRTPSSVSSEGRDAADAQDIRERYLSMTCFGDDSTGLRYLAGASSCGISDLTLVFHSQNTPVSPGIYLHYTLWGIVSFVLFAMIVYSNTRRFVQRFSVLLVIALIVFCWLFVQPNVIGWTMLLLLLVSVLRIQWGQMRTTTAAVTHNHSR